MAGKPIDQAIGVRRLGLGISGPHGTSLLAPESTHAIIHRAYELGVRLFDTAPSYGAGEAERRLGEALKRLPRFECIISTKVGVTSSGMARRVRDFSPDGVRRSIDGSLKRLGLHRLDWLFLHGPAPSELTPELLKMLAELKVSGQIGALGVAGRGGEIDAALATGLFSVFMAPVHAGLKSWDIERLIQLKATGAELIGFQTLAPALPRFPMPTTVGAAWRLARGLAARPMGSSDTRMTASESLAWALTYGGAHRVITTTTRLDHLEQNVRAASYATPPQLGGPSA